MVSFAASSTVADADDATVAHADVAPPRRRAGAVDDGRVPDQQIEHVASLPVSVVRVQAGGGVTCPAPELTAPRYSRTLRRDGNRLLRLHDS